MREATREKMVNVMIDTVCRIYGFEAKKTIAFCSFCENTNNYELIRKKYHKLVDNFEK